MLFTPSQAYMPNRHRQRSALRTFFPSSSFSPPDPKEPLRRGILFSSVATVLLLIGTILTWLDFNDVFGGKISMAGPLLIALALLMLLLSLRQFMLARRRNRARNEPLQMETVNTGGVTAVVVDHDDGNGAATIVVETWDSEEPSHDVISCRNNNDLAPPSYMDIAQSCSSNCPSLISHEDHNEAPPTYEETCGIYNSDTSLNRAYSLHSSSQFEGSPSPHLLHYSGYRFFPSEFTCTQNSVANYEQEQANQLLQTTCVTQSHSHLATRPCTDSPATQSQLCADIHFTNSPDSHSLHFLVSRSEAAGSHDSNPGSCVTNQKPSEWSRRSFSSIPSYTCLLSESGEVSSHIFDTSSIIEEMMPLLAAQGAIRESECGDLMAGASIIPTRSHSMSSVNTCRQGVPYVTSLQTGSTSPRADGHPSQLLHGEQEHSGDLIPSLTSYINTSDVISKYLPVVLGECHLGREHDQRSVVGRPVHVCDPSVLQPQPDQASTSKSSSLSSWHISNTEEISEQGQLLPRVEVRLDTHTRRMSESSGTMSCPDHHSSASAATTNHSSSVPVRGVISNTQDVQETI